MVKLLVVGDVGGTNGRLQVWDDSIDWKNTTCEASPVFVQTYRPASYSSLAEMLLGFFTDISAFMSSKLDSSSSSSSSSSTTTPLFSTRELRVVLAVCGPVWDNGRKNESNNIPRWCVEGKAVSFHDASVMEERLHLSPHSLLFMNDFEAVGYSVAALLDTSSHVCTRPKSPLVLQTPSDAAGASGAPACCVGAGTGLGACFVSLAQKGTAQDKSDTFAKVFPMESGMTDTITPRTEKEWRLLQYLQKKHGHFVEIERIVSGPGIVDVLHWLVEEEKVKGVVGGGDNDTATTSTTIAGIGIRAEVFTEIIAAVEEEQAALISKYGALEAEAEAGGTTTGNRLCLEAIDIFLTFFGRFLCTTAIANLPYGGLFVAGGILPKLKWRVPSLGAAGGESSSSLHHHDAGVLHNNDPLLEAFKDAGPKMSGTVARVPLWLMEDGDVGLKGCLYVATSQT